MDLEELGWLGEENFFLEFVSLEWDLGDCFLKGDAYFVLLEEDVFDALLGEDGFLCLDANLFLGVEDVCLLGDLFCVDSALLGEGVGDAPPGLDVDLVLLKECLLYVMPISSRTFVLSALHGSCTSVVIIQLVVV